MFQKGSFTAPSDSSGVFLVKIIKTRRCSTRKHADIGKFLRFVLKLASKINIKITSSLIMKRILYAIENKFMDYDILISVLPKFTDYTINQIVIQTLKSKLFDLFDQLVKNNTMVKHILITI